MDVKKEEEWIIAGKVSIFPKPSQQLQRFELDSNLFDMF